MRHIADENGFALILTLFQYNLYNLIEKLGNLLAGYKTLFLIDNTIADENLKKQRQPFLGLATSGRHNGHSLWLLMQSYTAVPMNIKMLYVCYLKKRGDWDTIHKENDVIEMPEKLASAKKKPRQGKHTRLVMKIEHPKAIL